MKVWLMSLSLVVLLTFVACRGDEAAPAQAGTISGQIFVADELVENVNGQAVLFIIARKEVGPPLAVKRVLQPTFPLTYSLSESDAMIPGTVFQGEMIVKARLDADGNAGQLASGDMTGETSRTVPVGTSGVDIKIDTLIP